MDEQLHVRIDNRLLHGQVVQFWIPHLEITRLVVADDHVATNEALLAIYSMAVPRGVQLEVVPVNRLAAAVAQQDVMTTMILLCNIEDAVRATSHGMRFERLTLGNVHAASNRTRITDSVYLSDQEMKTLAEFNRNGIRVEIQTFPNEVLSLKADPRGELQWSRP